MNYKLAFFLTLGLLIITGGAFLLYVVITTVAFMSAGDSLTEKNPPYDETKMVDYDTSDGRMDDYIKGQDMNPVYTVQKYKNEEFKFSFDLMDGEQALACPNKNEYNNNVAVEIMEDTDYEIDPEVACAKEGALQYISAGTLFGGESTKEDSFNKFMSENYTYEASSYKIAGLNGTRYVGKILPTVDGPIPDSIDLVIVKKSGITYEITSDFYNRNITIW
jgi:hypothetical protein